VRQRLGIAQAIMENPDVLILDEVTSALDEDGVEMTRNVLKQERDKGKLIIISSHNASDIEMLCDTIYRIRNQTIA
jgi:ABC-2 type transport system ATP-binding protein